jgi:hypothetical protein
LFPALFPKRAHHDIAGIANIIIVALYLYFLHSFYSFISLHSIDFNSSHSHFNSSHSHFTPHSYFLYHPMAPKPICPDFAVELCTLPESQRDSEHMARYHSNEAVKVVRGGQPAMTSSHANLIMI